MFFRPDTLAEITSEHVDLLTGDDRESDRWKLQLLCNPVISFYIYSSHLKASPGAANEQLRLEGVIIIREDADSLPEGTHIIFAGDMNFYANDEPVVIGAQNGPTPGP